MSNFFLSPNMSLVIPVPTIDPGPDWASNLNASLTILDGHTHNPGSGIQITPTGININSDLAFNSNNATLFRSVRFSPNGSTLGLSSDLGCLYETGVDLYYNDGNGNKIRITQSGSVSGAAGTITGLPFPGASASYVSASGTFVFQQPTNQGANLDVGSIIIRYPGSYPTPTGNFIILEAPTSLSSGYSLVLPALPTQTNVVTLGTTGIISSITYDDVGLHMSLFGANAIGETMTQPGSAAIAASMGVAGASIVVGQANSSAADHIGTVMTTTGANSIASNITGSINNAATQGSRQFVTGNNGETLPLKIVRGVFAGSSGAVISGAGYTVSRTGIGQYNVIYTTLNFSDGGAPVASCDVRTACTSVSNIITSGFSVQVYATNFTSNFDPNTVSFIVIGHE